MLVNKEVNLGNFEFWSGAVETVKYLTSEELETLELILEDIYPEGIDETTLNDLFWFNDDEIANWLGYNSFDEIIEREEA
jgi:hypothetical protein